jgi:hypothetical protein
MRTTGLHYVLIVSAVLAGGSALLLCPAPSEPEASSHSILALESGADCTHDDASRPAARWSARLVDDDNTADSTDDDGDDAPDGVIAAAPHRLDVVLNSVLLAHVALVSAYGADFDNRALRGPPEGAPSDSSQDSDDDDGDDAPDAVIAGETIRPTDLEQTFFIRNDPVTAYTVDIDEQPLRGPPAPVSDSSDVTDLERLPHALDDASHSLWRAFDGQSLRAPP